MEEKGYPWDGADRSFSAGDLAAAWKDTYSNGVVNADSDFEITVPSASQDVVQIGAGTVWIGGRRLEMTSPVQIAIPGETGLYTEGFFNGGVYIKANSTTREFEIITKYNRTGGMPTTAANEVLIAKFYYYRILGQMSTDIVVRSVTPSAIAYPLALDQSTLCAMAGLLKAEGGNLQTAVPGKDYLAGTMYGTQAVPLRFGGAVTASGTQGVSLKLGNLCVVLVSFTVSSVPTTPVPLVLRGLPYAKAGGAGGASFCSVANQNSLAGSVWGTVETDGAETVLKFRNGQTGDELTTDKTPAGTALSGVFAVYMTA